MPDTKLDILSKKPTSPKWILEDVRKVGMEVYRKERELYKERLIEWTADAVEYLIRNS